jgi:E3 ubiquitin-protein ligase MGRN1
VIDVNGKMTTIMNVFGLSNSVANDGVKEEDEAGLCTICFTNRVDTIISPCNHMCICSECAPMMQKSSVVCPMCRGKIGKFIKINAVVKNTGVVS